MLSNHISYAPAAIAPAQQQLAVAQDAGAAAATPVEVDRFALDAASSSVAVSAAARLSALPASVSTSDALMDFVSTTEHIPHLPNVLWNEISQFATRKELLHLRTASKGMAKWVDRSINSISVSSKHVLALLATLRGSTNLRHIQTLHIHEQPSVLNQQFPAIIEALTAMPHRNMNIEISMEWCAFSDANLSLLSTISPASLHLRDITLIANQARLFARVPYPLSLGIRQTISLAHILSLPNIPKLVSLDIDAHVNDEVVRAFAGHPTLTNLEIEIGDADVSAALVILAGNTNLKKLAIHNKGVVFSPAALAALAANRTIESLSLSGFNDFWEAGISEQDALILSQNTTLKALQISLKSGYRHLANMASLESLTIEDQMAPITRQDAHAFAQRAHLKTLKIVRDEEFSDVTSDACVGAITHLLSSAVENVHLVFVNLRADDIMALTANKALRSFDREYREVSDTDFALVFALAAHPTLTSLNIYPDSEEMSGTINSAFTREQQITLSAIWKAGNRPARSLFLDV